MEQEGCLCAKNWPRISRKAGKGRLVSYVPFIPCLVGLFPGLHGQFISVTSPRRTAREASLFRSDHVIQKGLTAGDALSQCLILYLNGYKVFSLKFPSMS